MSVDTLPGDYGLGESVMNGPERRIWRTLSVAPCPHSVGRFYVVQELAGEWKRWGVTGVRNGVPMVGETSQVEWHPRPTSDEPPVTRVLYCALDARGVMVNLNKDASQGRGSE